MTEKKYVIMCVGHTHTGKTTFAKKLVKEVPSVINIDNDEIASFINKKYPLVVFSAYNKRKRNFKAPGLKYLIFKDIFEFCLRAGLDVIHSSGNTMKDARLFIRRMARKYEYELITVYFNIPRKVILERIKNTKKDTAIFIWSKNWIESLKRQESLAQLPPSKKDTTYFEIGKDIDYKQVFNEVIKIIK